MLEITVKLHRKRAFVTGAASGLGAAICEALAADRWTIGMCDIREKELKDQARRVESLGGAAIEYPFDVTDLKAYKRAADKFAHDQGGIDLLVNNAGVAGAGLIGEFQLKDWEWILNTNVMGVVQGCHFFVPHFKKQRYGHILNVASAAAFAPAPLLGAYCSAKAAVNMFSEVLYNELRDYEVGVSVLLPEFFRSEIHERTRGEAAALGHALIENAPHSADEVALVALDGVAKNLLHIVFPQKVRYYWWLHRLAPRRFADYVRKEVQRHLRDHPAAHVDAAAK